MLSYVVADKWPGRAVTAAIAIHIAFRFSSVQSTLLFVLLMNVEPGRIEYSVSISFAALFRCSSFDEKIVLA